MHPPIRGAARRRPPAGLAWGLGLVVTAVAAVAVVRSVDGAALAATGREMVRHPLEVALALVAFAAAFVLRSAVWRRLLPDLALGQAWAAIHVAVAANHLLPLRLGEGLRVVSVVRRTSTPLAAATASTVALRTVDVVTVAALAVALAPATATRLLGGWGWAVVAAVAAVGAVAVVHLARQARAVTEGAPRVRPLGVVAVAGSAAAWLLEGALVWAVAGWAGIDAGATDALLVTAVSVAAQVAAVAPGGFGTYEAASTAAWVSLGVDPGTALAAALAAHALKTVYSLVVGAVAVAVPAPGLLGRLRLPRPPGGGDRASGPAGGDPTGGGDPADHRPVVLFMPARDEAPRVGAVVARVPPTVAGRAVRCIVVDDGSRDGTAAVAAAAGAEVVTGPGRGLGAAVRAGLAASLAHDPAAVAFCDADGEYAPEELERLVAPVLGGTADYVVGSRFAGDIGRMLPHRRAGNLALTLLVRLVARRPVTDGQSGYRALSPAAAAAAEVVHDYNYAQVLTLDLLAKGFRYAEVPISYAFRASGRSFVRLGPYLRRVVPAVWRELNTA